MKTANAGPSMEVVDIPPNAAKLIESLRHVGYDNYSAIADLIDNSVDANASLCNVWLKQDKGQPTIIVADNGRGMDSAKLNQALRLGSLADKNQESDLGRFGMGLTTATLSLCRRVKVLTKVKDGELLKGVTDIDDMIGANCFRAEMGGVNPEDEALFATMTGNASSGTVVQLLNVDRLTNSNLSVAADLLRKKVGRVFRMFLQGNCKIEVNGKPALAIDPLNLPDFEASRILLDETFDHPLADGSIEKVRMKIAYLPETSQEKSRELGINVQNQGFYVLRNLREIVDGSSLDLFVKIPMLNRFRAELQVSGNLDDAIQIDFAKSRVNLVQSLRDKIQALANPHITYMRNQWKKTTAKKEIGAVQHSESEHEIAKKAKILELPEPPKGPRIDQGNEKKPTPRKPGTPSEDKVKRLRRVCRFEEVDFGAQGQLYEAYPDGNAVVVQLNTAHPFYQRIIEPYVNNPDIRNAIDFLLFSMASAEMKHSVNEEKMELLTSYKTTVSSNLRSLCM